MVGAERVEKVVIRIEFKINSGNFQSSRVTIFQSRVEFRVVTNTMEIAQSHGYKSYIVSSLACIQFSEWIFIKIIIKVQVFFKKAGNLNRYVLLFGAK